jgi:transcriptional regulator with XRE-family HTH domain
MALRSTPGRPAPAAAPNSDLSSDDESATTAVLGERVRGQRLRLGLSGRELATAANVTPGFISQLERGLSTPSIATLLRICRALGLQIGDLFTEEQLTSRVVRRSDRPIYEVPQSGFEEARISADPRGAIEVVWCRMEPGGGTGEELLAHGSEVECVFVLKGRVVVAVGEEEHTLNAGDCLTIPGEMPHGVFNRSNVDAETLWVTAPAVY